MHDTRTVSLTCVIAIAFWAAAVSLILAEFVALVFTDWRWLYSLGHAGIVSGLIGATLTGKSCTARLGRQMDEAFAMGREVGRAEAAPDIRSVR